MGRSNCFVLKVALELDFGPSIVVEFACFVQQHFEGRLADMPVESPHYIKK